MHIKYKIDRKAGVLNEYIFSGAYLCGKIIAGICGIVIGFERKNVLCVEIPFSITEEYFASLIEYDCEIKTKA